MQHKLKASFNPIWLHVLLLLVWLTIGLGLRWTHLADKPLWTDEFSTIVFSLGQSFRSVPLNQAISIKTLLSPLQMAPQANVQAVVNNLLRESNHPPLYFILTHWWLRLVSTPNALVSVEGVRSLSVLLGVASIPAVFGLGWLAFRSRLVGHLAAMMMAVSPFAVYLAQEARHYTLGILWIIASLSCLVVAVRAIRNRAPLPVWVALVWIGVNGLGIATHYFFVLTLAAEAIVVSGLGLLQSWREQGTRHPSYWGRLGLVALGTVVSGLVWLPILDRIQDDELTRWIYRDWAGLSWVDPIGQAIAGWITMIYLLPIQAPAREIVWISGALLIGLVLWTVPQMFKGLRSYLLVPTHRLMVQTLGGFVGVAIALFLGITYVLGMDVTSAFRYNFVYFPAVVVLVGVGLAGLWTSATAIASLPQPFTLASLLSFFRQSASIRERQVVILIGCLSLLGGLTVVSDLGYQKTHRPDLVAQAIQTDLQTPTLVAIVHRTHGQTGRLMGIAWELQHQNMPSPGLERPVSDASPLFLLAHQGQNQPSPIRALRQALNQRSSPLNLWLINFQSLSSSQPLQNLLQEQRCTTESPAQSVDGYRYQLYHCDLTP